MPSALAPKDRTRREHLARVDRVVFANDADDFVILALDDGLTALGPASAAAFERGVIYRFLGSWQDDPARGFRFKFSTFTVHAAHGRAGVIKYLTDLCDEIGTKRAGQIFDKFGPDAVAALRERPQEVAEACKLDPNVCNVAAAQLEHAKRFEATKIDLFTLFDRRGFHGSLIEKCITKWGAKAPDLIRRNPFALLGLPSAGFTRCDRLWAELGLPKHRPKRAALCAWNAARSDTHGHTWLAAADLAERLKTAVPQCDVMRALKLAVRSRKLKSRRDAAGNVWLSVYERAVAEERIAAAVARLSSGPGLWPADRVPVSVEDGDRLPSDHQAERLKRATAGAAGMLLGGPGTGKSHVTGYLLREVIAEHGPDAVCVACPTGKAAVRATQALKAAGLDGLQAKTIHSTLGIGRNGHDGDGWGFVHGPGNPLPFRFVVIDEVSMLDTGLMADLLDALSPPAVIPYRPALPERVFEAGETLPPRCRRCRRELYNPESWAIGYGPDCARLVDPSLYAPVEPEVAGERVVVPAVPEQPEVVIPGTQLLLIGDPGQLPPVGHGAPLRDLIEAGVPHGELTQVRRNAGQIVHACARIRNGESFDTTPPGGIDLQASPPRNLLLLETSSEAKTAEVLTALLAGSKREHLGPFDPVWQTQVIVARNTKGSLSRTKLNDVLHPLLNPDGYAAPPNPFKVGDKIICLRNSWMVRVEPVGRFHDAYAEAMARDAANYNPVMIPDPHGYPSKDPEEVYVANGEIGRVVAVGKSLTVARFSEGDSLVKIPMGKQKDPDEESGDDKGEGERGRGCNFDHAYAITVHRAQGSEWPCIVVVADQDAGLIAGCEWWYTAVSRASKLCVLVGPRAVIDKQRLKKTLVRRKTFLKRSILEAMV